jgi:hypothetical protein
MTDRRFGSAVGRFKPALEVAYLAHKHDITSEQAHRTLPSSDRADRQAEKLAG